MSYSRVKQSECSKVRQIRPFETGEKLCLVAVVWQWYDTVNKKIVDTKPKNSDTVKKSYAFLLRDGRPLQLSRLWGRRSTADGFINAQDEGSPIRDIVHQLPMQLDEKIITFIERCGGKDYNMDDCVVDCDLELRAVEDAGETGLKDWYILKNATVRQVKPADKVTASQHDKVARWASLADITINPDEEAWFVSALGF